MYGPRRSKSEYLIGNDYYFIKVNNSLPFDFTFLKVKATSWYGPNDIRCKIIKSYVKDTKIDHIGDIIPISYSWLSKTWEEAIDEIVKFSRHKRETIKYVFKYQ